MAAIWQGVRAAAKRLGQIQARVILTLVYAVLLSPMALVFKRVADPLRLRRSLRSSWHPWRQAADLWSWAKAQF